MIDIQLFGTGRVRGMDRRSLGGAQHWRILQLLAVHRTLSKSALAELLWNGHAPDGYAATLSAYMSGLRHHLGSAVVVADRAGYRLDEKRVAVDLWDFDDLLNRARGLSATSALPLLERALGLAGQLPLAEESGRHWADEVRERYRQRVVAAATSASRHALAVGAHQRAHDHAALATDLDPAAEDAWRIRMSALAADGDRAGALRCYHACRQILADERGIDPAPATHALFRAILGDEPAPVDLSELVKAVLTAARELAGDVAAERPAVVLLAHAEQLAQQLVAARVRPLVAAS
ncbi:AfsR/SARP family transcriptional regulator [Paractinoplanes rishiriensis]|uniref:Uncharacterized protein n=1 Tax=Paractinoplanes rishiriensis TaxID=1050105 RepID=A0A919JZH4_9ACTN|nr:bacterial transcriptional activator domain-containing protein [Actinoplanes rishiriensis]GIE97558.1 hypothetical protein Ari01nite_50230 [Actinoplanes rishiriensis]